MSKNITHSSIRIWDLPSGTCRVVLRAKAVSCLDFYAEGRVFAVGFHDIGRVQIWSSETWQASTLSVGTCMEYEQSRMSLTGKDVLTWSLNDRYLVSAGADKALVCWDWRFVTSQGHPDHAGPAGSYTSSDSRRPCVLVCSFWTIASSRSPLVGSSAASPSASHAAQADIDVQ